jgi:hypothetical protein
MAVNVTTEMTAWSIMIALARLVRAALRNLLNPSVEWRSQSWAEWRESHDSRRPESSKPQRLGRYWPPCCTFFTKASTASTTFLSGLALQ